MTHLFLYLVNTIDAVPLSQDGVQIADFWGFEHPFEDVLDEMSHFQITEKLTSQSFFS